MKQNRPTAIAFACAFLIAIAVPTVAIAAHTISRDGDDYAQDADYERRVRVCDREPDGRGVYSDFQPNGYSGMLRIWDGNGADHGCGLTGQFTHIYIYNVCEQIIN